MSEPGGVREEKRGLGRLDIATSATRNALSRSDHEERRPSCEGRSDSESLEFFAWVLGHCFSWRSGPARRSAVSMRNTGGPARTKVGGAPGIAGLTAPIAEAVAIGACAPASRCSTATIRPATREMLGAAALRTACAVVARGLSAVFDNGPLEFSFVDGVR